MASATSFVSAPSGVYLVQPVSYYRCPQIFGSKPNSLMAKSLRLKKPSHEFTNRFPESLVPSSRGLVTPRAAYRFSEAEVWDLQRHARVTSSEEELQKMMEIEHLMKINYREFSDSVMEVIHYCIKVAKKEQLHIVETEHLMKTILNCRFVVPALFLKHPYAGPLIFYMAGVRDTSPMREATNKFIQCQPSSKDVVVSAESKSESDDVVLRQGPYLERLIQRAIEHKKEYGAALVSIDHLVLAFTQDERFGKQFMDDFQISHQNLHNIILEPKTSFASLITSELPEYQNCDISTAVTAASIPPQYQTIDVENLEARLSRLKKHQADYVSFMAFFGKSIKDLGISDKVLEEGIFSEMGIVNYTDTEMQALGDKFLPCWKKEHSRKNVEITYLQLIKQKIEQGEAEYVPF